MNDCNQLLANPLLTISDFDSDSAKPMVLCVAPCKDGSVRFSMPAAYVHLVKEFDGGRSIDEAITGFLQKSKATFSQEWLRRLVEQSLIPKGILIYPHQDATDAPARSLASRKYLYVRLPIMKPGFVEPIARRLGFMFRKGMLVSGIILFVAMHVYVYGMAFQRHRLDFNELSVVSIVELTFLSTFRTILHEFGHASAAVYYGCRRLTIGWGFYLIYKVMWTDVSEAWKLTRRQRAVVDVGGVYFESIYLLLIVLLYLFTGNVLFIFAFLFSDLNIARNFNPFLRMDGYWLVSDLLGIVNLRAQQNLLVQSVAARVCGSRASVAQLNLSRRARWGVTLYTALGLLFFTYISIVIVRTVVLSVAVKYPTLLGHVWRELHGSIPVGDVIFSVIEIFWRTMLLVGVALTVVRLIRWAISLAGSLKVGGAAAQESF